MREKDKIYDERLLQLAWQNLCFETRGLRTHDGRTLEIVSIGRWNTNQGPDFLDARLVLDGKEICGAVELHLDGASWFTHGHAQDPRYNDVILHVIGKSGPRIACREDGTDIAELVFIPLIDAGLLRRHEKLKSSEAPFPCAALCDSVPETLKREWMRRLGLARLYQKAARYAGAPDWEEALWQSVARAFGGPLNGAGFEALARTVTYRTTRKFASDPQAVEALLFGYAELFPPQADRDEYVRALAGRFEALSALLEMNVGKSEAWRFARMRPAAFPTIRLALLARLAVIPARLLEFLNEPQKWRALSLEASDYWRTRYRFGPEGKALPKKMGEDLRLHTLINGFAPVALAYAQSRNQTVEPIFMLLSAEKAEKNAVVSPYQKSGFPLKDALDSQGLLALSEEYCVEKRCIECAVGQTLLTEKNISI